MAPDTVKLNRELGEVDIRSYRAGHDQGRNEGSRTALAEMAGKIGVPHQRECPCCEGDGYHMADQLPEIREAPRTWECGGAACDAVETDNCNGDGTILLTTDELAQAIRDKYVTKAGAIDVAQGAAQLVIVKLAMMFKLELDVDGTVEQAGEAIQRAFVKQVAGMLGVAATIKVTPIDEANRTLDEVLQEAFTHFARMVRMDAFEGLPPHQMAEAFLARNTKGGADD